MTVGQPETICEYACQYACIEGTVFRLTGGPCGPCVRTGEVAFSCPSRECTVPKPTNITGWVDHPSRFCAVADAGDAGTDADAYGDARPDVRETGADAMDGE